MPPPPDTLDTLHHNALGFIITGGPGSGKSTLTDALENAGYARSMEAGRAVIQAEVAQGGDALPWGDRARFADRMFAWEMQSYQDALKAQTVTVFDRGLPDVLGYLRLIGLPPPAYMTDAAHNYRYNAKVLIAPPWRDIFCQDAERKQDFDEAVRTYEVLTDVYRELGYVLIELPRASVQARCHLARDIIDAG